MSDSTQAAQEWLLTGDDGVTRCWWPGTSDELYRDYHDHEWAMPVVDDTRLFEKVCLEGFQSGLAWITILRKRENFRAAFAGFAIDAVAGFGAADVERLLGDAGIVRHRAKIESTINNAARAAEMRDEFGSLAAYFWSHEPAGPEPDTRADYDYPVPSITETSTRISKDLKSRGWTWVGPTTIYAFMQAMGLVNDHMPGCLAHATVKAARDSLDRPS